MSIFDPTETTTDQAPKVNQANRAPDTFTADSKREPLANLLAHIEGHPWTVKAYYSQLLAADDPAMAQQITLSPVLQQYHKIVNLELRVSSPLTYEYIKERQASRLEGTANLYYGSIPPTRGDMFIADVGDGNVAVFSVKDVTPLSHFRERAYEINYREVDTSPDRLSDLEVKTVKTSYFMRDYLLHGRDPLVGEQALYIRQTLEQHGFQILNTFMRKYISQRHRYLLVPEQEEPTFDFLMAKMLQRFLNLSQYPELRAANWPDVYEIRELSVATVWDLLLENQIINPATFGARLMQKVGLTSTWVLKNTSVFHSLFYSSIKHLVWPVTTRTEPSLNPYQRHPASVEWAAGLEVESEEVPIEPIDPENPIVPPPPAPAALYYPVTKDDYYVFSEAFYKGNTPEQSQLELQVTLMLTRQVLNPQTVEDLCVAWYNLPELEQYYYAPVLLTLIDYLSRGVV